MVDQATRELGGVAILVNNAGIQHTSAIDEFPDERWDAVIAINLSSNFHAIKAVLPQMKKRNWGRIINIASTHGLVASATKSAYVAAKHRVGRTDQGRGAGDRAHRNHLQRHLPGLGLDPAGTETDR
jgi:3-hydroxybutyrate dehydrogenase